MCVDCFRAYVRFQLSEGKFSTRGRKIICMDCKDVQPFLPFEDEVVIPAIVHHKETYDLYQKARDDAIKGEQESIRQGEIEALRIRHENDKMKLWMELEQDIKKKHFAAVSLHMHRILNDLLITKCPHCLMAFTNWEGCYAVEHSAQHEVMGQFGRLVGAGHTFGCRKFFCGWCLEKFDDTVMAHRHVEVCPMSRRPGSAYGKDGDFDHVELRLRKEKIEAYLVQIASEGTSKPIVDDVKRDIQKYLRDLGELYRDIIIK